MSTQFLCAGATRRPISSMTSYYFKLMHKEFTQRFSLPSIDPTQALLSSYEETRLCLARKGTLLPTDSSVFMALSFWPIETRNALITRDWTYTGNRLTKGLVNYGLLVINNSSNVNSVNLCQTSTSNYIHRREDIRCAKLTPIHKRTSEEMFNSSASFLTDWVDVPNLSNTDIRHLQLTFCSIN
jgi:hypothetical protein